MKDLEKYTFKKYNKNYSKLFQRERYSLKKILPNANIEHVGSTAVPNLGGKGIIDILVSVPKSKINQTLRKLKLKRYIHLPSAGDEDRIFLEKTIKYSKLKRKIHLHLTHFNSKTWKTTIALRDYLRNHPDIAKEYEEIKKQAVKLAKGNGKIYRKYKHKFLNKILKKALKENYNHQLQKSL
jgi:GrpB-like predicted nucleotidyltransferase (UPF0157 family)